MPEQEIPGLVIEGGQFLTAEVWIENFDESFLLLMNTGERYCSLPPKIIKKLEEKQGIKPAGFNIIQGERKDWYLLTVRVGGTQKNHVRVYKREMPEWPGADGVLGMNWFRLIEPKVARITLDFKNQALGLDFA